MPSRPVSVDANCVRLLALLLSLRAMPMAAQPRPQPSLHVVRGVVYDSVARAPLADADVRVAWRDSEREPLRTRTDAYGRYMIGGLPSGEYVVGFYHEALDLLGLDAPLRAFDLDADSVVRMDLSIPAGDVVRLLRCGDTDQDSPANGLLAGFVRAGATHEGVAGATISATWNTVVVRDGITRTEPGRAVDTVGVEGTFSMCGVPPGTVFSFDVRAPGYQPLASTLTVPESGALRQDVFLVDTGTVRASARLLGRVVTEQGEPVRNGRAALPALGRSAPIVDGTFAFIDVPAGTWNLEVRAMGVEPRSVVVSAVEERGTSVLVRVSDQARRLDAVTVVGRADRTMRVLDDVLERHRTSSGSVFLPGSPQLRFATRVSDLLTVARGFEARGPSGVVGRVTKTGERCRKIGVYVNGIRAIEGTEVLDEYARPADVLAVEAFPDMIMAPAQWRTSDGTCAVVAMWTRK